MLNKPNNFEGFKLKKYGFVDEPEVKEFGQHFIESF